MKPDSDEEWPEFDIMPPEPPITAQPKPPVLADHERRIAELETVVRELIEAMESQRGLTLKL